ncbi:MAG: enoyl-CoA hydratase/isomerase family protein [Clostridia bacterium]|nr:enoyl-CoA hydratase/isomerase family protein [Clostridia bacterium]
MAHEFRDILYEKKDGVARITLNRPRVYNAFRGETVEDLLVAFEDANDDETVGVIVLTGAGGNFCTGGDVKWEAGFTEAQGRRLGRTLMKLAHLMRNNGKPIIAAVRGYCIGGGNELNLLCDLTVASENARFGQAGPRMGSVPVFFGTQLLAVNLGEKRAREIVYLCHEYTAQEALQMGWVNRVVPDDQLEAAVDEWCQEILDKSPQAIRVAKYSINSIGDVAVYPAVLHGMLQLSMMHATEEFHEGTSAFVEKRKPNFRQYRR